MGKLKLRIPPIKLDLFKNRKEVAELATEAVVAAEDQIPGVDNGKARLDAVADALNAAIDIPYVPEALETLIFRAVAQAAYSLVDHLTDKIREARAAKA